MERKHTVSLCMIVKNEEKYLRKCLSSVASVVDEIIIVDTGSTDGTVEIAKAFHAKVDYFQWNHHFSDARNRAISLATKDWILVLDADEYLRIEDRDKLIEALNDFSYDGYLIKTLNFSGDDDSKSYITNLNHRIFKNDHNYMYRGAIHEQVVPIDVQKVGKGTKVIDVGFYHLGYLNSVVKEKNKVDRNLGILEKILEENPDDGFTLFNLGTEYSQKGNPEKAIEFYNRAYEVTKMGAGFLPKLVMFRILCLINVGRNEEALVAISEGLRLFPDYTELVYYRGTLQREMGDVMKAIQSFETCLKMSRPRPEIEFQRLCYEFGPLYNLAEIYQEQEKFEEALELYQKCLTLEPSRTQIVYGILECLMALNVDRAVIYDSISKYFNLSNGTDQEFLVHLWGEYGYYEEGKKVLSFCGELNSHEALLLKTADVNE